MTEVSVQTALAMLKVRLNRADAALDEYLLGQLRGDVENLEKAGIALTDSVGDITFLVDYAAWHYTNRDKPGAMPEWLRLARRERWLQEDRHAT